MCRVYVTPQYVIVDDKWLNQYRKEIELFGMPECVVCGKPLRKGSLVDHFYPFYNDFNYHKRCLKRVKG